MNKISVEKISSKLLTVIVMAPILFFATNPTKDNFSDYMVEEALKPSDSSYNHVSAFDDFSDYMVEHGLKPSNSSNNHVSGLEVALMKSYIEMLYKRDNYYLISTYTANDNHSKEIYLGIFKIFIKIK